MALFFRKSKKVEPTRAAEVWKNHANVSRETVIQVPPGARRAAFERPDLPSAEDEYGAEVEVEPPMLALPRPEKPRIFVVANQKGGVGKTTTTVNIAMALAYGGLNVLVIDADPQGNASTALGIDHSPKIPGTYEVLLEGAPLTEVSQRSPNMPNLHVVPATMRLASAELELVAEQGRETKLKKALREYLNHSSPDYVFVDCPPSLGLLTINALVAATEIMVPIQCEYYALEGVSQLVRSINRVKGNLNEVLELSTVILTMYDSRNNLSRDVAREVRSHFEKQTLDVEIPRSVRIAEAPSFGQTVITYYPRSPGAVAYLKAAEQVANAVTGKE